MSTTYYEGRLGEGEGSNEFPNFLDRLGLGTLLRMLQGAPQGKLINRNKRYRS